MTSTTRTQFKTESSQIRTRIRTRKRTCTRTCTRIRTSEMGVGAEKEEKEEKAEDKISHLLESVGHRFYRGTDGQTDGLTYKEGQKSRKDDGTMTRKGAHLQKELNIKSYRETYLESNDKNTFIREMGTHSELRGRDDRTVIK